MRTGLESRTGLIVGILSVAIVILTSAAVYRVHAANLASPSEPGTLTLNPDQFQGETHAAYEIAQKHPELLAQLDCYCGCEQHEGHKNLLDCFRTNHGAGCDTCTGEAVTAGKLADGGMPIEQIREALRTQYAHAS
jgi:hypothetical protein